MTKTDPTPEALKFVKELDFIMGLGSVDKIALALDKFAAQRLAEVGERLEFDRTALADAITKIDRAMNSRFWLTEGRGSYEWNDDRYRDEFRQAVNEITAKIEPLKKIAADWGGCPKKAEDVARARIDLKAESSRLRAERDRLREALELSREWVAALHAWDGAEIRKANALKEIDAALKAESPEPGAETHSPDWCEPQDETLGQCPSCPHPAHQGWCPYTEDNCHCKGGCTHGAESGAPQSESAAPRWDKELAHLKEWQKQQTERCQSVMQSHGIPGAEKFAPAAICKILSTNLFATLRQLGDARAELAQAREQIEFLLGLWADDDLTFCGDDVDYRWPYAQRVEYFRSRMNQRMAALHAKVTESRNA